MNLLLKCGSVCLIDEEDYSRLDEYCWYDDGKKTIYRLYLKDDKQVNHKIEKKLWDTFF
jgi:hypothetical protein